MLPTDENMKHGALINAIQNASMHLTNIPTFDYNQAETFLFALRDQKVKIEFPPEKKSLEDRKFEFKKKLLPFGKKYGLEMIRDFYDWWSEHNEGGRKMKFEMQKTWNLAGRLSTWYRRNPGKYSNNQPQSHIPASKQYDRLG